MPNQTMNELDFSISDGARQTFGLECAWTPEQLFLNGNELDNQHLILHALTNLIRKKPDNLLMHVWRVFFCFRNQHSAALYAALTDLLITLGGRGQALGSRLIRGSRSQLSDQDYQRLIKYRKHPQSLPGNRYSLFSKGLIGTTELFIQPFREQRQHDILQIANDYIEYSQLDEAMETLETGIFEDPDRQELQQTLLEIYRSTRNQERCQQFYQRLIDANVQPISEWQSLLTPSPGTTR